MDKNTILKTATELKPVDLKIAEEYISKIDEFLIKMNSLILEREDFESLIGTGNINMMKDNHANHARFIASILKNYNPEVLVDTVLWVFRAYRSHGFKSNYWAAQLNIWVKVLKNNLSEKAFKNIYPYYEWMIINIPIFVKLSDVELELINNKH